MHVYVLFRVFMLLHHTTSLFWVKLRLRDTERGRTLRFENSSTQTLGPVGPPPPTNASLWWHGGVRRTIITRFISFLQLHHHAYIKFFNATSYQAQP